MNKTWGWMALGRATARRVMSVVVLAALIWSYDIWAGAFMLSFQMSGGVA